MAGLRGGRRPAITCSPKGLKMDTKIVEHTKDTLKFEVYDSDHALMGLLIKKLSASKGVDVAIYSVPHPLFDGFLVTVKGKDPEKEVKKALSELKGDAAEIKAAFKKAK